AAVVVATIATAAVVVATIATAAVFYAIGAITAAGAAATSGKYQYKWQNQSKRHRPLDIHFLPSSVF
ncbi:hypothetical protein, partial [Roseinatronobacter thiooxidans]|uniref:hypothetical protein n=1 Tax=Roseinatronobacter thiooxidans TaxID=121821 RepID=UPI001B86F1D3